MASAPKTLLGETIAPVRFLLFGGLFIAGTLAGLGFGADWRIAFLGGFDLGVAAFIASSLQLLKADPARMRAIAETNDANRTGLLAITIALTLVVLVAVATLIARPDKPIWSEVALIVATLALSWTFANAVFMLHYAHLYYLQADGKDQGGVAVPGTKEPDYRDFMYFAFTLGMTFQTSDVEITGRHMRVVVLLHCMLAFLFNMGVLAFTVNAIGGM
ncbi:MAG: DUF1345 domain-containing protein [Albidovulum sp.]